MKLRTTGLAALACMFISAGSKASAEEVGVLMTTSHGDIHIALYADKAPLTVANFLRYVDGEHFDGATFYRTVSYENDKGRPQIEVIQGGIGGRVQPFDAIAHEDTEMTGIAHTDGVISMARDGIGTASSEFFIVIGDQPGLDKGGTRNADEQGFAAFGKVTDGMDVVSEIHQSPSDVPSATGYTVGQIIEEPVVIENVRRAAP